MIKKMKRYKVERINGEQVITEDIKGNYRAATLDELEKALSVPNFQTTTAEVRIGRMWEPLRREVIKSPRVKRPFEEPEPIKPLSRRLRLLRFFHLYKDPLDVLLYKGKPDYMKLLCSVLAILKNKRRKNNRL